MIGKERKWEEEVEEVEQEELDVDWREKTAFIKRREEMDRKRNRAR